MALDGITQAALPAKELHGDDFWSAIDEADRSLNAAEGHFKALRVILDSAGGLQTGSSRVRAAEAAHFIAFELQSYISDAEAVLDRLRKACAGRIEH